MSNTGHTEMLAELAALSQVKVFDADTFKRARAAMKSAGIELEKLSRQRNHLLAATGYLLECPEITDDEVVSIYTARVRDEARRLITAYKSDDPVTGGAK